MRLLPRRANRYNKVRFGKNIFAVRFHKPRAVKKLLFGVRGAVLIYLVSAVVFFSGVLINGCRREIPVKKGLSAINQPIKVRVLLEGNRKKVRFNSESPATIESESSELNTLSFGSLDNSIDITISNRKINIGGWACPDDEVIIRSEDDKFSINGRVYRGSVKVSLSEYSTNFDIVNIVGLESYLAGVTGAEMPSYWERAALKAQTIAARSYVLHIKQTFANERGWDVKRTQANQVYKGVSAERPSVTRIVKETYGKTLFYKAPDTGEIEILPAYYSSICGGHTADSRDVFSGDAVPPLMGVLCPYCKQLASPEIFNWRKSINKGKCSRALIDNYPSLEELSTIAEIKVGEKESYEGFSRVISVILEGVNGKKKSLPAEDLRLTLDSSGMDFRSNIFEIEDGGNNWIFKNGRGFGHGVGLCQYGAEQMARDGKNYEQILNYYYPGALIEDIYENRQL